MSQQPSARDRILLAAMELFWAQGVSATSPRQIMAASNTGQSQFYHYFGSKSGLVRAVLEAQLAGVDGGGPIDNNVTSWAQMEAWFQQYLSVLSQFGMRRGCPVATVARDVRHDPELIEAARDVLRAVQDRLEAFFAGELAAGRLAGVNPRELAIWCVATMEGGVLMGELYTDETPVRVTFEHAVAYLRSLRAAAGG